ncbi:MAG: hypothetical protein E7396_02495 [Ruminococcaceae bacterium]|nr:hypothetical protein [Oscillospiraceae bacterium]
MKIKQISVYLENVKGSLRKLTKNLADNSIDIKAMSVADTTSFGIVRLIVKEEDIAKTTEVLRNAGFATRENHVVCVSVPNKPAGLDSVLEILDNNHISIEYMYTFNYSIDGNAVLILRLQDNDEAEKLLIDGGVKIICQDDINNI